MDVYYIKCYNVWNMKIPTIVSWMFRKFVSMRDMIFGHNWEGLCTNVEYLINKAYKSLQQGSVINWYKIVSRNKGSPKSIFIFWLLAHQRLPTVDKLPK